MLPPLEVTTVEAWDGGPKVLGTMGCTLPCPGDKPVGQPIAVTNWCRAYSRTHTSGE